MIESLLQNTQATGLKVNEFYGDKAYFRKSILEKIEAMEAEAYIPVSGSAYRIDESEYSYNKDSDHLTSGSAVREIIPSIESTTNASEKI